MSQFVPPSEEQIAEANANPRYTGYSVFRIHQPFSGGNTTEIANQAEDALRTLDAHGLVIRGFYDVGAFRADADFMVWSHAPNTETIQAAYSALRRSKLGGYIEPVWSAIGMHRPAEFNKSHIPAFLTDDQAGDYICVYPFVRSYEWYVLKPEDRAQMLKEHGIAAAGYKDIKANTTAAFALGDYEWLLAFEADHVDRLVDLMRDLRDTQARLHVREETPFFTGPRRSLRAILEDRP